MNTLKGGTGNMKWERWLRSPINNVIMILLISNMVMQIHYYPAVPQWLVFASLWVMVAYFAIWILFVLIFNRLHPNRKIRLITLIPPEFREEDEGQQWMNYRVTRRVYLLLCTAVPLGLVGIVYIPDGKAFAIVLLAVLGVAQQLLYWWELRKWEKN